MLGVLLSLVMLATGPANFVPPDGDAYSQLVAKAEADDQTTDFKALRLAWVDSAAKKRAGSTRELTDQMFKAAGAGKHAKVAETARKIIAINYTNLIAHKMLRQACKMDGDTACADHEHFVEFGLLNSITGGRDGHSVEQAWYAISIEEEYQMLMLAGAQPGGQALLNVKGVPYDRLDATGEDGKPVVYYFDISAFFGKEFSF